MSNGNGKWPLPEGWVEVTLADVAHVAREIRWPGAYCVLIQCSAKPPG